MPLFMDRHDLPGVTAEEVAQAHLTDVQIASKTRRPVPRVLVRCRSRRGVLPRRAARPEDMEAVHREGHGLGPNEIIAVSEDDVFRFLGRVTDPVGHTRGARAFRTMLFTDLRGSTSLLQEVGESVYMGLLDEHDLIIRRSLVAWRGREVKHTGDGVMASFEDVANALRCCARHPGRLPAPGVRRSDARASGTDRDRRPVSRSTTTTTCSARRSTSPAGSAMRATLATSSPRTSSTRWGSSGASHSVRVTTSS